MNTHNTQLKMDWLRSIGYTITPLADNSGHLAAQGEITIVFTQSKMEVLRGRSFFSLQGWVTLDLRPFQMIAKAFGLVPVQDAILNDHYGAQLS